MLSSNDQKWLQAMCEQYDCPMSLVKRFDASTSTCSYVFEHFQNATAMESFEYLYGLIKDCPKEYLQAFVFLLTELPDVPDKIMFAAADTAEKACVIMMRKYTTGHKRNVAGKVSINDVQYESLVDLLMSNCLIEPYLALIKLKDTAGDVNKSQTVSGVFGGHRMPAFNIALSLDDMNIRGRQILSVVEFCDGDYQLAAKLVSERDEDMIAYVNKMTALTNKETDGLLTNIPIAVQGGASSTQLDFTRTEYKMSILNIDNYANADVHAHKIDYSSMDIGQSTPTDLAIKILEHNGFEKMWCIPVEDAFGHTCHNLCYVHPETGDMFYAGSAKDTSCVYGGGRIIAARKPGLPVAFLDSDEGLHGNKERFDNADWCAYECDYRNSVIQDWKKHLPPVTWQEIPWELYPTKGCVYLPIPSCINDNAFYSATNQLPECLSDYFSLFYSESYALSRMINSLKAPELLDQLLSEEHKKFFAAVLKDKYTYFVKSNYVDILQAHMLLDMFKLAAAYVDLPAEEIARYREVIISVHDEADDLIPYNFVPDALDKFVLSQVLPDYPEPSVSELPQDALQWMKSYAPDSYNDGDVWRLYSSMRNLYEKSRQS